MPTPRAVKMIGRDAELAELVGQLGLGAAVPGSSSGSTSEGADNGPRGRFVLLSGDAGVGKTRLLMALREKARSTGRQVVVGHCLDLADSSLPYFPFSEIVDQLIGLNPPLAGPGAEQDPALARLLPERMLRSDPSATEPGMVSLGRSPDRVGVFTAVHDLLSRTASTAPLVVIVEDAHWADESTRDLISYLFSRPVDGLAMVVSYRVDDLHRRHPLRRQISEWGRLRDVARLQLEPLGDTHVRRLIRALHGGAISEREYVSIADRAQGNPFFIEELVGSTWAGTAPDELADLLLIRLDGLDDEAKRVVRLASVAGRQVSHELLAEVAGLEPAQLEQGLRAAVDANVLETSPQGTYSFRHTLLGEAIHDDLLPGERARLHQAFVSALTTGHARGSAAELAQHARLAGDFGTALRASIEAGDAAIAVGGASEAARHFLTAMELLASSPTSTGDLDETRLTLRCAAALVAAGRVSKGIKVLRSRLAALGVDGSDHERGELLAEVAASLLLTDTTESPAELAHEAVSLLREGPAKQLARALAVLAECTSGQDADAARELALEALTIAEQNDLVGVIMEVNTTLAGLGGHEGALDAWHTAARQAHEAGLVETELRARYFIGRALYDKGDITAAADSFSEVVTSAAAAGLTWSPYAAEARLLLAKAFTHSGRLDDAWRLLDVSGQEPPMVYEWLYFAQQMFVDIGLRGHRHDSAMARLREHWSDDGLTAILAGSAELLRAGAHGDVATAHAVYDEVVAHVAPLWHEWFQARLRLSTYVIGAEATAALTQTAEQRTEARARVDRLRVDGRRVVEFYAAYERSRGPEYDAWLARWRAEHLRWRWAAQVDPPDVGELVAAWEEAVTAMAAYGDVPELAHTRARLAGVLQATGDRAAAREVGELARATARELELQPVLDELRNIGSAPVPSGHGSTALTPREAEILTLVAQGRTNGEIGKQLFIATKTVSVHVSNILGKLGAGSRTEAAAIAERRRLL